MMLGVERGDGVEVEELPAGFDARAFKDADAGRPVVTLGAVDVAFATAAGGVEDEGGRVEAGGAAAPWLRHWSIVGNALPEKKHALNALKLAARR